MEQVGMVILTGAAPVVPGTAAPQDNRVAVCADLIAMTERAMVDPSKMVNQRNIPHNRPAERPPGTNVTPINGAPPFEATLVHLRGAPQPFVVKETIDEIALLRRMACTGASIASVKDLQPAAKVSV